MNTVINTTTLILQLTNSQVNVKVSAASDKNSNLTIQALYYSKYNRTQLIRSQHDVKLSKLTRHHIYAH